jgi:hypothetical protein
MRDIPFNDDTSPDTATVGVTATARGALFQSTRDAQPGHRREADRRPRRMGMVV